MIETLLFLISFTNEDINKLIFPEPISSFNSLRFPSLGREKEALRYESVTKSTYSAVAIAVSNAESPPPITRIF